MASPDDLAPGLQAFLRRAITSTDQLEVLLVLHGRADDWLTAGEVAEVTRLAPQTVDEALNHLGRENLLDVRVAGQRMTFHYAPGPAATTQALAQLAVAWRDRRELVMTALSRHAIERVRAQALDTFADAFVFGRGKKDG